MTKYHFIKIEYRIESNEPILYLWGRTLDTLEKKLFRVIGLRPRFYVLESEAVPSSPTIIEVKSGFKSIFSDNCKCIYTQIPSNVKDLRKYFTKTFQADIPFTRMALIELGIKTFFEVPDKEELHYTELKGE